MIKVSDYVVKFLVEQGISTIFLVTGGGIIHLDDSIGKNKNIKYICNHHEQASSFAIEGYSRVSKKPGVCVVTTGPGSTNAITGVISTWLDSVPGIVISGQVKRSTIKKDVHLRQLGDQEINIIDIVKPITKYAVDVMDPQDIRYHLEKAFYLAQNGRPGPSWINIPFDVQGAFINESELKTYDPSEFTELNYNKELVKKQINETIALLKSSSRPVLIIGKGIHLANAEPELNELITKLKIPVFTSFTAMDLIEETNPYFRGRQGTVGQRRGNFIVQNSDLVLCIGTRLNIRMISYNPENFARAAKKIVIDIDPAEFHKPFLKYDISILSDAKYFIQQLCISLGTNTIGDKKDWWSYANRIFNEYLPTTKEHFAETKYANVYVFFKLFSNALSGNEIVVSANGFACLGMYQSFEVKKNQILLINSGCASMGYALPVSIGTCAGNKFKDVYCIEGDGSLQMNIQELQTIKHNNLPIKIFVINNAGYLSIKETQKAMFNHNYMGSDISSGVSCPNLEKIANAYEIDYLKITNNSEIKEIVEKVILHKGPIICEIFTDPENGYAVKVSSAPNKKGVLTSRPLEDMWPFLPREEFLRNMIIKPIDEE